MSKRVEIAKDVKVSPEVKTSITSDEYNEHQDRIESCEADNRFTVTESDDGKYVITKHFTEDELKKVILDGFNALDDEAKEILALREYKTRDFQDSIRNEMRADIGLSTSMSTGSREVMKGLKDNPELFAEIKERLAKLNK